MAPDHTQPKHKRHPWPLLADYRYPMWLAVALISLSAFVGTIGLASAGRSSSHQVDTLLSESSCRGALASTVDVALLDASNLLIDLERQPDLDQARVASVQRRVAAAGAARANTVVQCSDPATTTTTRETP